MSLLADAGLTEVSADFTMCEHCRQAGDRLMSAAVNAPRPKRSPRLPAEARRAKMLEAARAAFVASGFNGATVKGIAADAGVDQAMVYRFFESKEKLFEEAVATPL